VLAGNGLFTLLGFMGLYTLLGLLFTILMYREISLGPESARYLMEAVHTAGL
jgi:cytochrome d ubiquinol oxidase subunit I